jgi:NAD(P)H dehydrogenase (quinone)
MHAHLVLAHPEKQSFNAHLVRSGAAALADAGWTVSVSDLYAMGFDPCERPEHYPDRAAPDRFDAQLEQRHASDAGTLPKSVMDELALMDRADLLVLQYPMWWHLPPAMLKGWLDRVLAYGEVYTSRKRFENGRFVGKRAMLSVTVGTGSATYAHDGRSGDIDLMLWPVNFSLAYAGYEVLAPFVAYGVEAGLRYSAPEVVEARLADIVAEFRAPPCRAAPSARRSRSTAWTSGGRMAASSRAPRSIRRSSGGSGIWSWSDRGRATARMIMGSAITSLTPFSHSAPYVRRPAARRKVRFSALRRLTPNARTPNTPSAPSYRTAPAAGCGRRSSAPA